MARPKNRARDRQVAERATTQGGVVSLEQLRQVGVSKSSASERNERGSLHRIHRGVYAVGHEAIDRETRLRGALLGCGDGAVISHGSAAAHWRLTTKIPTLIDVTVPVEAGRKLDGIRCHRCRYPLPEEVGEYRGVICTTPARTLVDEAGRLGTVSIRRLVEQAAVLKLLDLDACDRAIAAARGRRGVPALQAILLDWRPEGGNTPDPRSIFEARALPQLLALGLPRPVSNPPLRIDGRTLIPDFLWPEQRLIVETDGRATHETAAAFQRDRWRDQTFLAAGYRTSRVTWVQMRDDMDGVVDRIARALGQPPRHPRRRVVP